MNSLLNVRYGGQITRQVISSLSEIDQKRVNDWILTLSVLE